MSAGRKPGATESPLVRLVNRLWTGAAATAFLFWLLNGWIEGFRIEALLRSKTNLAMLLAAGACLMVRFLFRPGWRLKLFGTGVAVLGMELILNMAGWLGILPFVNTKERIPWGRVYWTAEGRGNSIRNRYGWHFPEFDLTKTNRVAVIGDSFVEAVEVHRTRNAAALLAVELKASQPHISVLGLGNHGMGPAHYLEILHYAHRHFQIQEAIVVLYLGNDFTDCTPPPQGRGGEESVHYALDADGRLGLSEASARALALHEMQIEAPHRPPWLFLPRLISSHSMLVQLPLSARRAGAMRRRIVAETGHPPGTELDLARLGLKAAPFAVNPSPEAREGMAIMKALLERTAEYCAEKHIRLRLVTVPFFPPDFHAQTGTNWTARLGDYDFLGPERELAAWAAARNIPLLPLGGSMKQEGVTTETIRSFYLSNGSGHFSEAGHRFAADAVQAAFFSGRALP